MRLTPQSRCVLLSSCCFSLHVLQPARREHRGSALCKRLTQLACSMSMGADVPQLAALAGGGRPGRGGPDKGPHADAVQGALAAQGRASVRADDGVHQARLCVLGLTCLRRCLQLRLPSLQAARGVRRQALAAGAARAQQLQRACLHRSGCEPASCALTPQPRASPGARLRGRKQAARPRGRHLFRGGKARGAPQGALSACWAIHRTGTGRLGRGEVCLAARARRFAAGRVRVAPGCNAAPAFRVRLVRCEPALARRQQPRVPQTRARRRYSCTAPLPLRTRFASTSQPSAA